MGNIINPPIKIGFGARKGGEGKSFGAVNVAGELVSRGFKTLIVICDQQEDLANRYLIELPEDHKPYTRTNHASLAQVLTGEIGIRDAIYQTRDYTLYEWNRDENGNPILDDNGRRTRTRKPGTSMHLDMIPAGRKIYDIDVYLKETENGIEPNLTLLSDILKEVEEDYDFIIFDIPPSDQDISMCAYAAADYLMVPYAGIDSTDSVVMMTDTVKLLNQNPTMDHQIEMFVYINKYNPKSALYQILRETALDIYDQSLLQHPIRQSIEAENSKASGIPLCSYVRTAIGEDVAYVTDELLSRMSE